MRLLGLVLLFAISIACSIYLSSCNIDGPGVYPNNRASRESQEECDVYVTNCAIHDGLPPWNIGSQYEITPLGGGRYEICELQLICG